MAEAVYLLCALTSLTCAVQLLRGWKRSRARLLLWGGLCFSGLALNNALLFVDFALVPTSIDLTLLRAAVALVAMLVLLFGLVWDSK